jgi:hypothetical protein
LYQRPFLDHAAQHGISLDMAFFINILVHLSPSSSSSSCSPSTARRDYPYDAHQALAQLLFEPTRYRHSCRNYWSLVALALRTYVLEYPASSSIENALHLLHAMELEHELHNFLLYVQSLEPTQRSLLMRVLGRFHPDVAFVLVTFLQSCDRDDLACVLMLLWQLHGDRRTHFEALLQRLT